MRLATSVIGGNRVRSWQTPGPGRGTILLASVFGLSLPARTHTGEKLPTSDDWLQFHKASNLHRTPAGLRPRHGMPTRTEDGSCSHGSDVLAHSLSIPRTP